MLVFVCGCSASGGRSTRISQILHCDCDLLEKNKLGATDGFRKKYIFFFSVFNRTLQSIPGVNSRIYNVDQNPTPYSAPRNSGYLMP